MPEPNRLEMKLDVFSMFSGYANRDLLAPVFGKRPPGQIGNQNLSIVERWKSSSRSGSRRATRDSS